MTEEVAIVYAAYGLLSPRETLTIMGLCTIFSASKFLASMPAADLYLIEIF